MDLHFFGPAALTRAVLPSMRERGTGAIVQMSSMGGRFTFPGVAAYSATKFALEGWSEAIPAYDEQIEPLRTGMPDDDGKQPGDPAKAAAAILLALNSADPPLRLALGNDAVDAIRQSLDGAKAELAAWERVGRSAVFD
jgi:hypothetical protein